MCLDEIGESSTEVTRVYGVVKVEGFATLPAPQNVEDWLCPEEKGHDARSQMRGLETVFTARHSGRGLDSSLKRVRIFV